MRIVINHLTRMGAGYVCAAGVDLASFEHVRPVLQDAALPFDVLARYGGPFEIARVLELGSPRANPHPPHVEDRVIVPAQARSRGSLSPGAFWELLERLVKTTLGEIFGSPLRRVGRSSCGTDAGQGTASLGCFRPSRPPQLCCVEQGSRPRIRMQIDDGQFNVQVGVTDIRLYGDDHLTPCRPTVERIAARLDDPAKIILGVGLTRPYQSSTEPEPAHWVQVNSIHLAADPVWELG